MESFNIGRTLSRTFTLIFSTLGSVGLFLLIAQLINAALQYVFRTQMLASIANMQASHDPAARLAIFSSGWYWGYLLVTVLSASFMLAGSIHGYLKAAWGQSASLAECFSAGLSKMLPVLGLYLLWGLGVGLGWILLIVPGLILMTMWSAAMPVLVGEDVGVVDSFGRSRALTKGSRWVIFAVLLIFLIVIYAVMFGMLGAMIGGAGGMMQFASSMNAMNTKPWLSLVMIPFAWIMSSLLNALLTSIYVETVTIKEGGATGHLSQVFH